MRDIDTVVIGGGQAGLAMSRSLSDRGIEHVVLERGRVGERWRSERWDSLRLLTPRWQSRLPGFSYQGPDPDGYMSRDEVVSYLARYAHSFGAPVESGVSVTSVRRLASRYTVDTSHGAWRASNVVIATGHCDVPFVPEIASGMSPEIHQVATSRYKNPSQLPDGGVLVVGASATGVQLAAEIHASGRPVTISVGRHTRLPRTYGDHDILWWLDGMGVFDERAEDVGDLQAARGQPSFQLVGRADRATLDLGVLARAGVRLVGRTTIAAGRRVSFADDLVETIAAADAKMWKLLARVDAYIAATGGTPPGRPARLFDDVSATPDHIDLKSAGIQTVLWATGYRRCYPWLHVPVLDERGEIQHAGGVTAAPGLYVMGLRFMRRRKSNFIDGQVADAAELSEHLASRRRLTSSAA